MSQFLVNIDGSVTQDKVFLLDRMLNKKGEIWPVSELRIDAHLNSNWEVSFKIYKYNNGNLMPNWDKIVDLALIEVEGKGIFEITTPTTDEECTYKVVSGMSFGEVETCNTNVTLQINTEEDIARTDYDPNFPTVLYRDTTKYADYNDIWEKPENKAKYTVYNEDGTVDTSATIEKRKNILRQSSLLHRTFEKMPHYSIGHVDDSIKNIQRVFSCDDISVYEFLKQISEEIECIFIFDKFKREVNCYDLLEHCTKPECIESGEYRSVKNGKCKHCGESDGVEIGYGKYSGVEIDTYNLAETITLTGDKDNVKNCFKIEGADDTITNMIGTRLIGGNYIWKFGYQLNQMSNELKAAIQDRESLVTSLQEQYNALWDEYNKRTDKILYYESGMMPSPETSDIKAKDVFEKLFGTVNGATVTPNGQIQYACANNKYQTYSSIIRSVENFAKLLSTSGHTIELQNEAEATEDYHGTQVVKSVSFNVHIYLPNVYSDAEQTILTDEYTSPTVTLEVKKGYDLKLVDNNDVYTTDYYLYLKRQLDTALAKSDIGDDIITFDPPINDSIIYNEETPQQYATYDNEANAENLSPIHYTMYGINRLQSFYNAYSTCSSVIAGLDSDISTNDTTDPNSINILKYLNADGKQVSIYDDLLLKYKYYMECISARQAYLESIVSDLREERETIYRQIQDIQQKCDMESFLKARNADHDLWIELNAFRRESVYKNDNFIGDGVDESQLMQNIEALISRANEAIEEACQIKYSITATIGNLLVMREFRNLWDDFSIGNFLHAIIDDKIHTMRLIFLSYDYDDLSHSYVEFSDVVESKNSINDMKKIIQQARFVSSNFSTVSKQAEKGQIVNQQFNQMRQNGLDVANTMITSANHQAPTIDEHGMLARMYNDDTQEYDPEQSRWIHNLLCFTTDNWAHTETALGKIHYQDPDTGEWVSDSGLNARALISDLIMSNKLKIKNQSGTYSIDDNGFNMTKDGKYINFDTNNPSIVANDGKKDVLDFNSNGDGKLVIQGDIEGSTITGSKLEGGHLHISNGTYSVDIDPNHESSDTNKNYLFSVNNADKAVMGVSNDGNGYFSGKIEGSEIEGGKITQTNSSNSRRTIGMENGILAIGNARIGNGLLNYYKNEDVYSNAMNISCDNYGAEIGFRWNDDEVHIISSDNLSLGEEQYYRIKDINMVGKIKGCTGIEANGNIRFSDNQNGIVFSAPGWTVILNSDGIEYYGNAFGISKSDAQKMSWIQIINKLKS